MVFEEDVELKVTPRCMMPTTLPVQKGSTELPVSWLLSGEEEQLEFHVSICAGAISPTSAGRSDWRQCLLRTEAFELRLGAVAHPPSRQGGGSECPGCACLGFHSCSWSVCDQMRLLEPLLHWERRHKHPGRRCVLGQQLW